MTAEELLRLAQAGRVELEGEWILPSGRIRGSRWNNNTGKYEPDPDDH